VHISIDDDPVWLKSNIDSEVYDTTNCFYDDISYEFTPRGKRSWALGFGAVPDMVASAPASGLLRAACIRAGVPILRSATTESFVPQMVNLDLLDAISFTKGCYVGQEIVARTQNLGRIKRRMFRLMSAHAGIAAGDTVNAGQDVAGYVVDAMPLDDGMELLAVLKLDKLNLELTSNSVSLSRAELPYTIPEADD